MIPAAGILLHGFGQRYDLPITLAIYLYAAAGVVVISFVLVALFAGDQVGAKAVEYPRRPLQWMVPVARSAWPRIAGGTIGIASLLAIVISGLFGSTNPVLNPAEYLVWIYFWAGLVIVSGLVGNLWYLSTRGRRSTTRSTGGFGCGGSGSCPPRWGSGLQPRPTSRLRALSSLPAWPTGRGSSPWSLSSTRW
jgi:hypothetical protein